MFSCHVKNIKPQPQYTADGRTILQDKGSRQSMNKRENQLNNVEQLNYASK